MFQLNPKYHPVAQARNLEWAARYAGHYLLQLKRRFGDWRLALIAYNWGPANLANALNEGRQPLPASVRYAGDILRHAGLNL